MTRLCPACRKPMAEMFHRDDARTGWSCDACFLWTNGAGKWVGIDVPDVPPDALPLRTVLAVCGIAVVLAGAGAVWMVWG